MCTHQDEASYSNVVFIITLVSVVEEETDKQTQTTNNEKSNSTVDKSSIRDLRIGN